MARTLTLALVAAAATVTTVWLVRAGENDRDIASALDVVGPATEVSGDAPAPTFTDALVESPMTQHPDFVREVAKWVDFWEEEPRRWFPDYLARMEGFAPLVDSTLAAEGLPWSLRYLPVIESGYSPTAVSSAQAVGIWQFMEHTAGDMGMEVSRLVDERRDPYRATPAAARYLSELHAQFDSWFLALAAYNAGPNRIEDLIARYAPDRERNDALYWALRPVLPRETADFVPNLFGAMIVASDPVRYGYAEPEPLAFEFDTVSTRGRLSFEVAAAAAGTSRGEIARLNPRFVEGFTPSDRVVRLRLPVGTAPNFRAYFDLPAPTADGSQDASR